MNQFEISVFESSFYSVFEDVDLHYARSKVPRVDPDMSLERLRDLVMVIIETLEGQSPESHNWHIHLQHLYALIMQEDLTMRSLVCSLLLEIGALNVIGQSVYAKLRDLE